MARKHIRLYDDYYYMGGLTEQQLASIEAVYSSKCIENLKHILNGITLRDFQTLMPAAAYYNPRFFCGDGPGLGKTVMSSAYLKILRNKNLLKKFMFTTTTDAIFQIRGEIEHYTGMKVLPLIGDKRFMESILKNHDYSKYDGIITAHSGLISNTLLKFLSNNIGDFNTFILDESSCVKDDTTQTYTNAKNISQQMDRVLLLNGTAFETHLFDFYNQFDVLDESILPSKTKIKEDYCKIGGGYWKSEVVKDSHGNYNMQRKFVDTFKVVGYQNQADFRNKIRFHFMNREKKDVYEQLPEHDYSVVPVDMSGEQVRFSNPTNYQAALNSPETFGLFEVNTKTVPKLAKAVETADSIVGSGQSLVIYCWFRAAQENLKKVLAEVNIKSEIINGDDSISEKENLRGAFQAGEYPVLITNIDRAINLDRANHLMFYTIPTNPSTAYQIMCRIDRNNDKIPKSFIFLLYNSSKEAEDLENVLADREFNANMFTGTTSEIFAGLVRQLQTIKKQKI